VLLTIAHGVAGSHQQARFRTAAFGPKADVSRPALKWGMHITAQYERQYAWRDWQTAYRALPNLRRNTVLDLGCAWRPVAGPCRARCSRDWRRPEAAWQSAEVDALYRLAAAGVRVPRPRNFHEGVLLMELVVDEHGDAAARLNEGR
jgi:hypothetical protein